MALNNPPAGGVDPNNPNPGGVPAFDPTAFRTEIMSEFNKTLNGFAASLKKDMAKLTEKPEPEPIPNPDTPPAPEAKTIADLNIWLGQMEKASEGQHRRLEAQKQETVAAKALAAEEKRVGAFNAAITDIPFASPKAREQFRDAYLGKVKYSEDGSLIVEDRQRPGQPRCIPQGRGRQQPPFSRSAGARRRRRIAGFQARKRNQDQRSHHDASPDSKPVCG